MSRGAGTPGPTRKKHSFLILAACVGSSSPTQHITYARYSAYSSLPPFLSPVCPRWVTGGTRSKERATRPTALLKSRRRRDGERRQYRFFSFFSRRPSHHGRAAESSAKARRQGASPRTHLLRRRPMGASERARERAVLLLRVCAPRHAVPALAPLDCSPPAALRLPDTCLARSRGTETPASHLAAFLVHELRKRHRVPSFFRSLVLSPSSPFLARVGHSNLVRCPRPRP